MMVYVKLAATSYNVMYIISLEDFMLIGCDNITVIMDITLISEVGEIMKISFET